MPELPEVEICCRQLASHLAGKTIRRVTIPDNKKIHLPSNLVGRRITKIYRFGKFIILQLDDDRRLLIHLGMTGWFELDPPAKYRLSLETDGATAYFEDPRRFGNVRLVSAGQQEKILGQLGTDPLTPGFDLTPLRKTKRPVKVALQDQRLIAGVGNIYASEALWRARIHPTKPASRLRHDECRRLKSSLIHVLRRAVAFGPKIFESQRFAVYDRKGQPCRRCRNPVQRMVLGGRGAYFCPHCQR
jgi:formamidopyrimidine-DNA glycosylase